MRLSAWYLPGTPKHFSGFQVFTHSLSSDLRVLSVSGQNLGLADYAALLEKAESLDYLELAQAGGI